MAERNADVPPDRRIEFRMGINLGDIMKDGRDIYGDGVNVAARLEALAEPGPDGDPVVTIAVCYNGCLEAGEKVLRALRT